MTTVSRHVLVHKLADNQNPSVKVTAWKRWFLPNGLENKFYSRKSSGKSL